MASRPFLHMSGRAASHNDSSSQLRIVVLGYIVRGPIGGMAWHHLQYALGLHQLGHDVLFLEDSDEYPSCYDPSTHLLGTDPSYGISFATHAFRKLGMSEHWAYYDAHRQLWLGPAANRAIGFCEKADLLVNVSGVNPLRSWHQNIERRIRIDTDPVFTQVRHLTNPIARTQAREHNAFFSFGELIATGQCTVPDDGFPWQPTRQPIVIDAWPNSPPPNAAAYTTVMQWDSYPAVEFENRRFGVKGDSFNLIRSLPSRAPAPLEIALGSPNAPRRMLQELGWRLVDPLPISRDPWTYQRYLQGSRGEFSIAKHGYVASRCGWFSERTACYLASGRPAIIQDTGFSTFLPSGCGAWPFETAEGAVNALRDVESNYLAHCRAAREFAMEYFDSQKVLRSLLDRTFEANNGD